jgi:thioredoxin reductase (NADPH)
VAVVGGGDTAITDAMELSQLANKIVVIHRRDQLRAGQVLQERAFAEPKIEFAWDSVVEEIIGEQTVDALRLRNVKTGQLSTMEVDGVFIATGLTPNSQRFAGIVEVNETEHVVTNELMITSAPGIFAAGDIRKNSGRQVSTAVGDGATAAIFAFKYLREGG